MYNMYLEHLVFNPNSERVECENVFKMPFTRSRFLFDRSIYDKRKERFQLNKKKKQILGSTIYGDLQPIIIDCVPRFYSLSNKSRE